MFLPNGWNNRLMHGFCHHLGRSRFSAALLAALAAGLSLLSAPTVCSELDRHDGEAPPHTEAAGAPPLETGASEKLPDKRSSAARALVALKRMEPDVAIGHFAPLLNKACRKSWTPENKRRIARYLTLIGKSFLFDENERAAAQCFAMASAIDRSGIDAQAHLASALCSTGEMDRARAVLQRLQKHVSTNLPAAKAQAMFKLRFNDYAGARQILETASAITGGDADWQLPRLIAYCQLKQGFSKDAAKSYRLAAKKCDTPYLAKIYEGAARLIEGDAKAATQAYKEAGAILPADPAWLTSMGTTMESQLRDEKGAREHLVKAVACRRLAGKAYTSLEGFFVRRGNYDEGLRCLDYLRKLKPWSVDVDVAEAKLYRLQGKLDLAEQAGKRALAKIPSAYGASLELADMYAGKSEWKKESDILEQALKYSPQSTTLWLKLGDAKRKNKQWSESFASYKKVLDVAPKPIESMNVVGKHELALAHAGIGAYFYQDNKFAQALVEAKAFNDLKFTLDLPGYLTLVKIRPGRIDFKTEGEKERLSREHEAVADMLLETRQLEGAIAEYNKAIEQSPDDSDLHSYLMNVLVENGNWMAAAQEDFILSQKMVADAARNAAKWTNKDADKKSDAPPPPPPPVQSDSQ